MRIRNLGKTLIVLTLVAIMGMGATAFAGKGRGSAGYAQGYGQHGCDGSGYGRGYGDPGFMGNLSEEEGAKLNEERNAFSKATQELRQNIYQKRLELNSELAKKNPDPKKAGALQKELSGLKGQLDQKRTEHRIRMNKINPGFGQVGRGFHGREMGRWQGNQGRCW
jgi:zinc resistance-associated protein